MVRSAPCKHLPIVGAIYFWLFVSREVMRYSVGSCRLRPHQLDLLLLLVRQQCADMGVRYHTFDRIVLVDKVELKPQLNLQYHHQPLNTRRSTKPLETTHQRLVRTRDRKHIQFS